MDLPGTVIVGLMAAAFLAGLVDAVAGGGGLLTMPALLAAGLSPAAAVATNKLQSTLGVASSVAAFARAGRIEWPRFAAPAAAALGGAALGAASLRRIDPQALSALLPWLLLAVAIYHLASPPLTVEDRESRFGRPALILATALVGAYDGFFGPGAGALFATGLIALAGLGAIRAIAHARLLNLASNLAALAVFAAGGEIQWLLGLAMGAASLAGAQLGARAAMRFGPGPVKPLLIALSLGLSAKLLWVQHVDARPGPWRVSSAPGADRPASKSDADGAPIQR